MDEKTPIDAIEIIERVDPLIKALPTKQQEEVRQIVSTAISFQGPLPPPAMLEQYGRIIPNGPERLMVLLEIQTKHRINMETKLVDGRIDVTKNGQWMAFILSLFFGSIAVFLAYIGHEILAGTIATTTIVGLAVVFVLGKEPGKSSPKSQPATPKPTSATKRKRPN